MIVKNNKQTKQQLMPHNSNNVHKAFESTYGPLASGGELNVEML